jgi:hypothetical protein
MSETTQLESALDELLAGKTTEEIVGADDLLKDTSSSSPGVTLLQPSNYVSGGIFVLCASSSPGCVNARAPRWKFKSATSQRFSLRLARTPERLA